MLSIRHQSLILAGFACFSLTLSACFGKKNSAATNQNNQESIKFQSGENPDFKEMGGQATDGPVVKSN
ncbi:MAG: hypothetical protein ACK448_07050, partial [Bacteroidota bacterium]